jgi:hypothetical protein
MDYEIDFEEIKEAFAKVWLAISEIWLAIRNACIKFWDNYCNSIEEVQESIEDHNEQIKQFKFNRNIYKSKIQNSQWIRKPYAIARNRC